MESIMAKPVNRKIIAVAPVTITAAAGEGGEKLPTFDVVAYNGGALSLQDWDLPVVIDLEGMKFARTVVADVYHDEDRPVGHVTEPTKTEGELKLAGVFSMQNEDSDHVVVSYQNGFPWQASVEVSPVERAIEEVDPGKKAKANGQEFAGPLLIARVSTLTGFGFVHNGADPATEVKIAATAASNKETKTMKAEVADWVKQMLPSVDIEALSADEVANLEADFNGREGKRIAAAPKPDNIFAERKLERQRRKELREIADRWMEIRPDEDIEAIEKMHDHAVEAKMSATEFRCELYESSIPPAHTVMRPREPEQRLNGKVIEAAICMTGGLPNIDKHFNDQTLQTARDKFRHGIGLKEVWFLAAQNNGYSGRMGSQVDIEVHRAAFGYEGPSKIKAFGFSTFSLAQTLANTANLFIREAWMNVESVWRRIAAIRSVSNFQTITTVSLTGGLMFDQVGADGEIPHGEIGEEVFTNKADTYGRMFAITRTDLINDRLDALTQIPRRLGRGGALKLNDIFWAEFLNNGSFFASANANVSTVDGQLGSNGLAEALTIFSNQTDPDGNPLGAEPQILLVPTALWPTGAALMGSPSIVTGANTTLPSGSIWNGRFRLESSAYMANTSYTGYSAVAWYLLADPQDIPVIEVVALNGRVEPTVETADAPFNVLGVQMRGYSDVGVRKQDHRGGVRADGSAP
jgi:hypothetical protein